MLAFEMSLGNVCSSAFPDEGTEACTAEESHNPTPGVHVPRSAPQFKLPLTLHPYHSSGEGSHFPGLQLSDIFHIETNLPNVPP